MCANKWDSFPVSVAWARHRDVDATYDLMILCLRIMHSGVVYTVFRVGQPGLWLRVYMENVDINGVVILPRGVL